MKRERAREQAPVSAGFSSCFRYCSTPVVEAIKIHLDSALSMILSGIVNTQADREFQTLPCLVDNVNHLLAGAEYMADYYMEGILTFITKTLDAKTGSRDPPVRAACLTILRHIMSRKILEPRVEPYKDNVIATIKLAMGDMDWRVRKAIVACVITMGASDIAFFSSIGGVDLLTVHHQERVYSQLHHRGVQRQRR